MACDIGDLLSRYTDIGSISSDNAVQITSLLDQLNCITFGTEDNLDEVYYTTAAALRTIHYS